MELTGNGLTVLINPAEQPNDWLVSAAKEIADAAKERGLELPLATGEVAVEAAMQAEAVEAPTPPTKESLTEQLPSAAKGYNAVIDALNSSRRMKDLLGAESEQTVAAEFETWFSQDKLAYVTAAQEADPEVRFTLVATPNVVVNDKELAKAAKAFGKNQPYETYVWDALYSCYTPEQLSGTEPSNGKGVVFSLIPTKYTPDMDGTVVEQRAKFAKLQADTPDLKVPSPLEAVAHWQTLRSAGENLADNTTFDRTYIRHFDLPEQRLGGWLYVPDSYVSDRGRPALSGSVADGAFRARVAVG